jgi:hypothetical protein
LSAVALVSPRARNSSLRLSDCILFPKYSPETLPANVLPPSFGIMLTMAPSALLSAEMPLVDIEISCTVSALAL